MTPANDFAALVRELEEAARETIYASMSQDDRAAQRLAAETELADARAALLAYGAGVERDAERLDFLQSLIVPDSRVEIDHVRCDENKRRGDFVYIGNLSDIDGRVCGGVNGFGNSLRAAIDAATRPTEARDDG